jgi:gamma-glutamylaminecyclotransferase
MKLFVYGTLQQGRGNHRLLAEARFIGKARTTHDFTLRSAYAGGGFPYLLAGGDTSVFGELYEIDDATLARCDRLEGYPHHYDRREIELAAVEGDGPTKALAYLLPEREHARMTDARNPIIASGSWAAWSDGRDVGREDDEVPEDATTDEEAEFDCAECGEPAFLAEGGTAHHADEDAPDGIDHDADADHVPFAGE